MYVTLPPFNPRYPDATIELKSEWVRRKPDVHLTTGGFFYLLQDERVKMDGWIDGYEDGMGWDGMRDINMHV